MRWGRERKARGKKRKYRRITVEDREDGIKGRHRKRGRNVEVLFHSLLVPLILVTAPRRGVK